MLSPPSYPEQLGDFRALALDALSQLKSRGFRLAAAGPDYIEYRSPRAAVRLELWAAEDLVYREVVASFRRGTWERWLREASSPGVGDHAASIRARALPRLPRPRPATSPGQLRRSIEEAVERLRTELAPLLDGEEEAWEGLEREVAEESRSAEKSREPELERTPNEPPTQTSSSESSTGTATRPSG